MGKIVSNFFISLDGVVESPDKWHFPYFDDAMGAVIREGMATTTAFLMGRRLYDEWSPYWPGQGPDVPFAEFINTIPKYVLSTTLTDPTWQNTTVLSEDVAAKVRAVKESTDGDVGMSGSATTARRLLANGLLDELNLLVHPIAVGSGQRLFEDATTYPLELLSSAPWTPACCTCATHRHPDAQTSGPQPAKCQQPGGSRRAGPSWALIEELLNPPEKLHASATARQPSRLPEPSVRRHVTRARRQSRASVAVHIAADLAVIVAKRTIWVSKWYHELMAMTLRTDEALEKALTALAVAEGASRQEIIRRAVLDRYERGGHAARVEESSSRMIDEWADVLERLGTV